MALLRYYEAHILRCSTMEAISEFLKEGMPQLVVNHMTTILDDAHHMDLEMKLQNFETEYFVLEELTTSFSVESDAQDLKSLNESFKSHNKELIDQLAYCRGMISNLESVVTSLQETVREQQRRIERCVSLCGESIFLTRLSVLCVCTRHCSTISKYIDCFSKLHMYVF